MPAAYTQQELTQVPPFGEMGSTPAVECFFVVSIDEQAKLCTNVHLSLDNRDLEMSCLSICNFGPIAVKWKIKRTSSPCLQSRTTLELWWYVLYLAKQDL